MLKEAKKALRVTVNNFDSDIAQLLAAGAKDLEIAGVVLDGIIDIEIDEEDGTVEDLSSIEDPLLQRAIITYAAMKFGNPPNYDKLVESYETQKCQLMHATGYTRYREDGDS